MQKQVSVIGNTPVGTLARGLDILSLFARRGPELSQTEISAALSLPLATVHRLTGVLSERGFLERDPRSRRLRLGLELTRLLPPLLSGMQLPDLARRPLVELAARTRETVNLAVLQSSEVVYLLSETGDRLLTFQASVGQRLPAYCSALGKCLLAYLPEEVAQARLGPGPWEARTAQTLTTWKELAPALAEIREDGISYSAEEYEIGLVSIAAPIYWTDGPGSAAINVSLPASRLSEESRSELAELLRKTASAIDAAVGIGRREPQPVANASR